MERKKMTGEEARERAAKTAGWTVENEGLEKRFNFGNFAESLAFINRIGAIAEAADHHPDITFGWGYAEVRTTTHDRGGITDADFSLVERIDRL